MTKENEILYKAAGHLIKTGYVQRFERVFDHVPPTNLAQDLGLNPKRFGEMIKDVKLLRFDTIFRMAKFMDIDEKPLFDLIYNQYHNVSTEDPKKKKPSQ